MAKSRRGTGWKPAIAFSAILPLLAAGAPGEGAGRSTAKIHAAASVTCADCHGKAEKPADVATEKCLACHGPVETLVEKTSQDKPVNPHDSPHWGRDIDCTVCHRQHQPTVNWCAHCHVTDLRVP